MPNRARCTERAPGVSFIGGPRSNTWSSRYLFQLPRAFTRSSALFSDGNPVRRHSFFLRHLDGSPIPCATDGEQGTLNDSKRIAIVVGTRPEAVKLAPVVQELNRQSWAEPVLVATGQHGEVVRETLSCFGLRAQVELTAPPGAVSVSELTAGLLSRLGERLRAPAADAVVVQGDTASALAGAMAGFYSSVPVVHVEAGLRSGDLRNPFPEEANRRMIAEVSDLHLAPTRAAHRNLVAEGVAAERILVTGNTVIDAVVAASRRPPAAGDPLPHRIANSAPLVLVTAHRRENWGAPIRRVGRAVASLSHQYPEITFVVAAHMNPSVRTAIEESLHGRPNVQLPGPIPYDAFARLLARSVLVITDSGGIQEEAAAFGIPVLVTRDNTERTEGIDSGLARLVGTQEPEIVAAAEKEFVREGALSGTVKGPYPRRNPYGDGEAARRCAAACGWLLGRSPRPSDIPGER
ncbi:UDP-N-acetylglucosamine 2-epimerase (non-hydrolyzing) [Streptomyces sp. NRRL B-1677]|uniref:UDP-N-acetylglucosamine 2-epimerase (non-hydrolyzing) n=2 Tax=Streptomyces TaxID=1883 RepID=A0A3B0AYS6_9ACTN|nr:UDP-N-acetylglucosamine 2-epimerase (non-hydrolyzing) [Streptomyces sp. NRRL B-1677]RKN65107.1 UDP-N-acetylglucosamine 2-epimerase (non-hydrolyzing) [Streptomyces klenkii]